MFLDKTFQNLSSSLAIISLNLLSLTFLLPVKEIDEIFVCSPLLISKIKSKLFVSISLILTSTSEKL